MKTTHRPAFPIMERSYHPDGTPVCAEHAGMSLRDWFAGQVLAGGAGECGTVQQIARECYDIADAMLAEREKREHQL